MNLAFNSDVYKLSQETESNLWNPINSAWEGFKKQVKSYPDDMREGAERAVSFIKSIPDYYKKGMKDTVSMVKSIPSEVEESIQGNDYVACIYPMGLVNYKVSLAFKHEQIDEVLFKGRTGKEYDNMCTLLNKA